jgi:pimeloyl-ACP methyl ester carboxylesterase
VHGEKKIYVLELGKKRRGVPPLVLFHGIGVIGIRDFLPALAPLSRDRQVIGIDLPGFGHSERNDDDLTPDRMVRKVASVLHALGVQKVDVVGHSSGAALALLLAAQKHELVRRLVLVGVVGVLRPETLLRSQLHENLNELREERPVAAKVVEKSGDALVNALAAILPSASALGESGLAGRSANVLLATSLLDYNFGSAIAHVRTPSLLVWGDKDDVAPIRVGHLLDDRLPMSELEYVKDAGHVVMKDQPVVLAALINTYLDDPLPRPQRKKQPDEPLADMRCEGQSDQTFTGEFDEIVIDNCKNAWLNRVQARRIVVRGSDVRLDHASVSEGVIADGSTLVITGGELRGEVPLNLGGGSHDVAGTVILGTRAAVHARDRADVLFSVTRLTSPRGTRFAHEEVELASGQDL